MTGIFAAVVLRDLRVAARIGGAGGLALVFFLAVVVLVPFGLGPDLNLLARIAPAILWLAALMSTLIGLDRLFQADEEDGGLDGMRLSPAPLEIVVLAKVAAHWLSTGLPLAVASPFCGLLLAAEPAALGRTALALLLGTPALTFAGAVAAGLAATIRRGGLLVAILAVPLAVPTLIFGVAASDPDAPGAAQALLVLGALTLAAGAVGTVGAAAALRAGGE